MVNFREIIRLKSQNHSNSHVASSVGSSRNTVAEVWNLAQEKGLTWPTTAEARFRKQLLTESYTIHMKS